MTTPEPDRWPDDQDADDIARERAELAAERDAEWWADDEDATAYEPPMTGAIYRHRHERRDIA